MPERERAASVECIGAKAPDLGALGKAYIENIVDSLTDPPNVVAYYVKTPPGAGSPKGLHSHSYNQIYFVLDGSVSVEVEGEPERVLTPYSLISIPAGLQHRNWNSSECDSTHLVINTLATRQ
ncbi:MAG TPA: cupin domain-containing protein [Trebonia sp.]|jgi:quercetin dioxygenase-like cupin family protein|nr:cupin domain-containing protein [Trebonia sp.]